MSSLTEYRGTVVVVPTRNRAHIAKNAIRSVLNEHGCDVKVMVSDNSNTPEELRELDEYCAQIGDDRLSYVRPPEPLPMSKHWDWAIGRAMDSYNANHFSYLTDRMMFKPHGLTEVLERARTYSDKIISYNHDRIVDNLKPIRVEQYPATQKLLEVKTLRLSYLYSQSIFHHGLPRMLNCIVPRAVLERIRERFGNVFASIAPDFNFCCRCLEMEESILFYDKSVLFHYALDRSNGATTSRGEITPDNADFLANLPVDNSIRNYATPIPQLITAANALFNEYFLFRQQTQSPRFFEVNLEKYLQVNAEEIKEVSNDRLRAEMHSLLVAHGLGPAEPPFHRSASTTLRKLVSPTAVRNRMRRAWGEASTAAATKPLWLFLARHFGVAPPGDNRFEFGDLEEATDYIIKFPRRSPRDLPGSEKLLEARELPFN